MTAVLDRIRSIFTARTREQQEQEVREYHQLVSDLASGKTVDPEETADILEAHSKTPDDLEADVQHCLTRGEQLAGLARLEALRSEEPALRERLRQAQADLDAALARHRAVADVAEPRRREIAQAAITVSGDRQRLRDTCRDQSLVNAHRAAEAAFRECGGRLIDLDQRRVRFVDDIAKHESIATGHNAARGASNVAESRDRLPALRQQLGAIDAAIQQTKAEQAAADARLVKAIEALIRSPF